ncbi:MAG: hypothetical protein WCZ98_00700 [Sideroxydans sp.]
MSKYPKNECALPLPVTTQQGSRYFIEKPDSGWKPISGSRVIAFQRGKLCIPEQANKKVRVAIADIEMNGNKPTALSNLTISEWQLDEIGFVDQAAFTARIVEKIDGGDGESREAKFTPEDLESIKRRLGIP